MQYGRVSILGSTGSIGTQTLDVCERLNIPVTAITARKSSDLVEQQARKFKPELVVMTDENAAKDLKVRLADTSVKIIGGEEGVLEAASHKTQTLL